jgi:hypothetical protein
MIKLFIDNNTLAEDFLSDAHILGIVAPLKDYHFCWILNQALGCDFRRNAEIEIQLAKKGREYFFSVYEYKEVGNALAHYIYCNQFDGEYLLPEFKHLDYLWLLKCDEVKDNYITSLKNSIKDISGIQLITELDKQKIKNKIHLVF